MPEESKDTVRVGIGVFIRKGDQILLHKRLSKHANNTWACPGGHLEKFETFAEAGLRETLEEAGPDIKVTEPKVWTVVNTVFPDEDRHYACIFLICDWISGEAKVMEPDKCEEWKWFECYDLPSPLIEGCRILKEQAWYPNNVNSDLLLPA
jgi:8-oxo-dGTP diphosphatase